MTAPRAPKLAPLRLPDLDDAVARDLVLGESYEALRLSGEVIGCDLSAVTLNDCELLDWDLRDTTLTGAAVLDCVITGLFATSLVAPQSTFRQVRIDGAKIGSAELFDARLRSAIFTDSRLGYVNLRGAGLTDVVFRGCVLDGIDLGGATATRVAFEDCRVGDLDVTGAALSDIDLRGLQIGQIRGVEGLAGATLTPVQIMELAPYFAAHLGVRVLD